MEGGWPWGVTAVHPEEASLSDTTARLTALRGRRELVTTALQGCGESRVGAGEDSIASNLRFCARLGGDRAGAASSTSWAGKA